MSRNSRHILSAATLPIIGALYGRNYNYTPDDQGGGAGGGGGKADKADDKGKAAKIELTEDELNSRITSATESAAKAEREKAEAAAKKKEEDAAKEAAKKQGEFEKLYEGEKAVTKERDATIADRDKTIASLQTKIRLNKYLADNHAEYVNAADTIFATLDIAADAKEADVDKAIKAAVDDFTKKFKPATGGGGSGAPSGAPRGKLPAGVTVEPKAGDAKPPREMFGTIKSRF